MKRIYKISICLFIFCLLIIPFFRGVKDVELDKIQNEVMEQAKKNGCVQKNERDLLTIYHLKSNEYQDFIYYGPSSYLDVNEIMIVYAPKHPEVYQKVIKHIDEQKKSFEGYGIEQTQLLKEAKVVQLNDYVICIVSKDETVSNSILELFR